MAGTASHHREGHRVSGKISYEPSKSLNLTIIQILTIRRLRHHYYGKFYPELYTNADCKDRIAQNDYPALKVILIGGCALLAAFQRE